MNKWEIKKQEEISLLKEELLQDLELEQHLKSLADAFYKNLELDNHHIGLDSKRPFGNSYIPSDIMVIIDLDVDVDDNISYKQSVEYCYELYNKLPLYLIICWERYNETL